MPQVLGFEAYNRLFQMHSFILGPYNHIPYTLDDVGQYDYPAGIDRILELTGHKDIQVS